MRPLWAALLAAAVAFVGAPGVASPSPVSAISAAAVVAAGPVLPSSGHAAMPGDCGRDGQGCREEVTSADRRWTLTLFRNFPLSGSVTPTQAVVVIHGTGRNAAGYFASMMAAAQKAGVADHTLVIAPWFKTSEDSPASGEAVWTKDAWKGGQNAQRPQGLSSFSVIDEVLATLAARGRFPNLRRITLAGHSAGAQFAQRYAAFGRAPNGLPGVAINYVVANPSSFVYFGPDRPARDGTGFAVPSPKACPDFDQYKYGMAGRSGYPATLTPLQAARNYLARRVTLLSGAADTVDNGDLDTDCAGMLQGPNRALRAANYLAYTRALGTGAPHDRIVIPGVAHEGDAMFASPLAWPVLFGVTPGDQAGQTR